MADNKDFLMYKNKPLVRNGRTIYYGFPYEPCVAMIQIVGEEKQGELDVVTKASVQILSTDESLPLNKRILKSTEGPKNDLYTALSLADFWLTKCLKDASKAKA